MKEKTKKSPFLGSQITRRDFGKKLGALGIAGSTAGSLLTLSGNALAASGHRGGRMRAGIAHGSTTDMLDPASYENGFTSKLNF